jgi:hypothetical protein
MPEIVKPASPKGAVRAFSIGTTPIRVLPDNPYRINWSAKNLGSSNVYYGFTRGVESSGVRQGWEIAAAGGSVSDEFWTGEVWMVAASGTNTVIVQEVAGEEIRPFRVAKAK